MAWTDPVFMSYCEWLLVISLVILMEEMECDGIFSQEFDVIRKVSLSVHKMQQLQLFLIVYFYTLKGLCKKYLQNI